MPEDVAFASDLFLIERVATILELTEWRWTIADVLAQPDALLDDVIRYKSLTGKIKRQIDANAKNAPGV